MRCEAASADPIPFICSCVSGLPKNTRRRRALKVGRERAGSVAMARSSHSRCARSRLDPMVSELFDGAEWMPAPGADSYTDISTHVSKDGRIARIAFDRPEVRNAF